MKTSSLKLSCNANPQTERPETLNKGQAPQIIFVPGGLGHPSEFPSLQKSQSSGNLGSCVGLLEGDVDKTTLIGTPNRELSRM